MTALNAFNAEYVDALSGPEWLVRRRKEAFRLFEAAGLPTESEEVWRYSGIGSFRLEDHAPRPPMAHASGPGSEPARLALQEVLDGHLADVLRTIGPRSGLVATLNGEVALADVSEGSAAGGLRAANLGWMSRGRQDEDGDDPRGNGDLLGAVIDVDDAFVRLNEAFLVDAVLVDVAGGGDDAPPVVIVHWVDGDFVASFPRTVIRVADGARARVVEIMASPDHVSALACPVVQMELGRASTLDYVVLELLGSGTTQFGYQRSALQRDARLVSFSASMGGARARLRSDSTLAGEGSSSQLLAAYFGTGEQVHDLRTLQEHRAPHTTSDLVFVGSVAEQAHSVYSGLIRVHRGASGTKAFQTNRNLVLSETARADSVPNLDIQENDVQCSHASAIGPVDENQRYYLESRGAPPRDAERLIVLGFFEDMIQRAPFEGVRKVVSQVVAEKLGAIG